VRKYLQLISSAFRMVHASGQIISIDCDGKRPKPPFSITFSVQPGYELESSGCPLQRIDELVFILSFL